MFDQKFQTPVALYQSALNDIDVYKGVVQFQKQQHTEDGVQLQIVDRALWAPAVEPFFKLNIDAVCF